MLCDSELRDLRKEHHDGTAQHSVLRFSTLQCSELHVLQYKAAYCCAVWRDAVQSVVCAGVISI